MKKLLLIVTCFILLSTMVLPTFAIDVKDIPNADNVEEDVALAIAQAEAKPVVPEGSSKTRAITGTYPTRSGVILVTPINSSLGMNSSFVGHAAIIYAADTVIESFPKKGVITGDNNWNKKLSIVYGVDVNDTNKTEEKAAAKWCQKRIGCSYNYLFTDVATRSRFYCSHLVWASYWDLYGIDLNTDSLGKVITPMELVTTDETTKIYEKTE